MPNGERIKKLLTRNVEVVIEKTHLEKALASGKKLRVKLGIDPTSPDLHLGHAVVLSKLREFQDLGHKAVLIIGDFTARIGDPSGRDKTRPPFTEEEVRNNMRRYLEQAGKIIDVKKAEIVHNNKWLGALRGARMMELLGLISFQQITEREDFQKRLKEHKPIRLHELLYPVMQAYDSVEVKADVEIGGTDQTFNLMIGRDLMEKMGLKRQDILTVPLLVGTDGVRKMSKSYGNYVALDDSADDMFGKLMSVPDEQIGNYFELATDLSETEITKHLHGMTDGKNPKFVKESLASEVVKRYRGEDTARRAKEKWEKLFSKKEAPSDLPILRLRSGISALEVVLASDVVKSKSEARRLIFQGGFEINGVRRENPNENVNYLRGGEVLKVGKKNFFRAKI